MTKTSVLIPDGESSFASYVVQCLAQNKDIEIHVLSKDPSAIIRHSRFITSFHTYNLQRITTNPNQRANTGNAVLDDLIRFHHYEATKSIEVLDEIVRCAHETGAQIVLPVDEHIVRIVTGNRVRLREAKLLILLPELEMFNRAIDKWQLAQFIAGKNVAHPATVIYTVGTTTADALNSLRYPVIIKPTDQGNALGIRTFDDAETLLKYFQAHPLMHEYIIQPLISGYDIDCSVLCQNGAILSYTIQKGMLWSGSQYRAAVGIEFVYDERVIRVVERLMQLLNWSGVAHIDLRYDEEADEIKVIEINGRYWGSLLGSLHAGINFPLLAVQCCLGEPVGKTTYAFNSYFMGKTPIEKLLKNVFNFKKNKIRLRDTSVYYALRDPMPVFFSILKSLKSRLS